MIDRRRYGSMVVALSVVAVPLPARLIHAEKTSQRSGPHARTLSHGRSTSSRLPALSLGVHGTSRAGILPKLTVVMSPADPLTGQSVRFRVLAVGGVSGDYRWDLDGSGRFAVDTRTAASVTHVYQSAGARTVSVRVTEGARTRLARVTVLVRARAQRGSRVRAQVQRGSRASIVAAAERRGVNRYGVFRARIAGDPPVTIVDFAFNPATTTIHVGDTITWTNTGSQPHTATANNHSFDTGILNKGQSASHTFTQAGTFSYYCTVHPYMHGTIVVTGSSSSATTAAANTSGSPGGSSAAPVTGGASTASTPTDAAQSAGGNLPMTGLDLTTLVLTGLLLGAVGLTIRRAVSD